MIAAVVNPVWIIWIVELIINHHETIPVQKDRIIIHDYEFDVLDVTHTRIEMVKLKKLK